MKVFFTKRAGPIPAPPLPLEGQDTNHCSSSEMKLHWACQVPWDVYSAARTETSAWKQPGCADGAVVEGGSTKDKHRPLGREAEALTPHQQPLQKPEVEHKSPFFLILAQEMRAGMRLLWRLCPAVVIYSPLQANPLHWDHSVV